MEEFDYKRKYWLDKPVWSASAGDLIVSLNNDSDNIVNDNENKDLYDLSFMQGSPQIKLNHSINIAELFIFTLFFATFMLTVVTKSPIFFILLAIFGATIYSINNENKIKNSKIIKKSTIYLNRENSFNNSNNLEVKFAHSGLTRFEAEETVKLLNKLISENNETEYEKIIKNLLNEEKEYYEGKIEHEKILNSLNSKKVSNRVVTSNIKQSNKLSDYTNIFNNSIINTDNIKKDFIRVSKQMESLQAGRGEIKILKDSYNELFNNTKNYEKIVNSGGVISKKEWAAFHSLIKTCESIIKATEVRELEGSLADSTTISSIFLKDKYNIKEEVTKTI